MNGPPIEHRVRLIDRYGSRAAVLDAVEAKARELASPAGSVNLTAVARSIGCTAACLTRYVAELRAAGRFGWVIGRTDAERRIARDRWFHRFHRRRRQTRPTVHTPRYAASLDEYRARAGNLL